MTRATGLGLVLLLRVTGCSAGSFPASAPVPYFSGSSPASLEAEAHTRCDHMPEGPATPPAGAVRVDPTVVGDISAKTEANAPGTTFWLAPDIRRLNKDEFAQVAPKSGNAYVGAPGAVLYGAGRKRYAFTGKARNVTLQNLIIRAFNAPANEGS